MMMKLRAHTLGKLTWTAFVALLAFTAADNTASAAPTAIIAMSTSTPHVGTLVVFDGSASICDNATGCSYTWQWFWRSADGTTTHVGGQMGRTPIVTYTFDGFAASKPYVIVTLTVGAGRVHQPSTAQVTFVVLAAPPTDVEPPPARTALRLTIDNAPDPFNPTTTIRYNLPTSGMATVAVFDVGGRRVRTLVARNETAGVHSVLWDGRTDKGDTVHSGVYFARIETASDAATDRLTIAR